MEGVDQSCCCIVKLFHGCVWSSAFAGSNWRAIVLQVGTVRMHFCGSDGVVHNESSEGWGDVLMWVL
jgi:hypothetical protein